jgi:hypothetical protein
VRETAADPGGKSQSSRITSGRAISVNCAT